MTLIKKIYEDATAGDAIGVVAMPLFSQMVRQSKKQQPVAEPKIIKYTKQRKARTGTMFGIKEALRSVLEMDDPMQQSQPSTPDFDQAGVIAKLKSLETAVPF